MKLLQKHFDTALESPDGIKKLRELILTLAMQGKLVKQEPNEQAANQLLKEIKAEKEQLIKEGKIKKQKELPPVKPDEVPYKVPKGWVWTRLGEVFSFEYGNNLPSEMRTNTGEYPVYGSNGVVGTHNKAIVKSKCIVIGRKGSAGALNLSLSGSCWVTDVSYYCVPPTNIDLNFAFNLLKNKKLDDLGKGIKPGLNRNEAYMLLAPIPPRAEQKRIVDKIDELMALCDKLEAHRKTRDEKRLAVHTTVVDGLLTATNDNEFDKSWHFITRHFDPLYSVKKNVAELKKAILSLAMQGKLVKQDPNDQPASQLLKEIKAEKERLIKEEALKTTASQTISDVDIYLKIPDNWEYSRLGNIAKFIDYRGRTPVKVSTGIPLITAKNIRFGYIDREPFEYVTEEDYETWMTRGIPRIGDLLFTTEAPLGNIAIINIEEKFALAQRAICFQLHKPEMAQFIRYLIMSDIFQNQLLINSTGMTAKGIKASRLKEIPVPLPPLAEQKRIVAKIDEIMELCNNLENQINQATTKHTALFDAVLAKV